MKTTQEPSPAILTPTLTLGRPRRGTPPGAARLAGAATAPPGTDTRSSRLAHRAEAAAHARRLVRSALGDWHIAGDDADSVLLVASELVTNALEHARPPLVLRLSRECAGLRVRVGVTDGGPATRRESWASSRAPGEHGRGLAIVEALAAARGTAGHPHGTTRWATVPVAREDVPAGVGGFHGS
ncbi:ATP-binding protein [Streptomyces sp. NPDC048664]|uniref:ATP-binding protein n=1 Tax=Streptomyces sp. NPDC048664 TaxID=3154505 RepID=UPI00343F8CCF